MKTNLDTFMDAFYEEEVKAKQLGSTQLKEKLQQLLGQFSFPKIVDQPKRVEVKEFATYKRERFLIPSYMGLMMPFYVLTPNLNQETYTSVIALHGHGYGSKEIVGLREDGSEDREMSGIHRHFAVELVNRGVKVFAPEVIGFGERVHSKDVAKGKLNSCYSLATLLLMSGKTIAGLRVAETRYLIDLLNWFTDVNRDRVGMIGFSGGALVAAYTAALDERVKATVLTGFTNTYKGSILRTDHCIDNYIPQIATYGELPDYISLICPRALFVEAGTNDPLFPAETTKKAIEQLKSTFAQAHELEQFSFDLFPGKHEVSGRESYDWLVKKLRS